MSLDIRPYTLRAGWYSVYTSLSSFEYNPHLIESSQAFHQYSAERKPLIRVYRALADGLWVVNYSTNPASSGHEIHRTSSLEQALNFAEDYVHLEQLARLVLLNAHFDSSPSSEVSS